MIGLMNCLVCVKKLISRPNLLPSTARNHRTNSNGRNKKSVISQGKRAKPRVTFFDI